MNRFPERQSTTESPVGRALHLPLVVLVLLVLTPAPAAGYIDPITGSIILQILAAAALGAALTAKRVWAGITGACTHVWDGMTRRWRN